MSGAYLLLAFLGISGCVLLALMTMADEHTHRLWDVSDDAPAVLSSSDDE